MEKPEFISDIDYELLKLKYPNNLDEIIEKINNNYPVQYLIGNVNFYGYDILVDERVLIPRFETEGLVDETIKLIRTKFNNPKVLEVGTGSGCISITLSKELNIQVDTIDISKSAIEVATKNAQINKASINIINSDINYFETNKKYNVLISNPPYVDINEEVDPKIKYEPQNAIYAKDNGLEFYKIILDKSHNLLENKFIIAFEIGAYQKDSIVKIAKEHYPNAIVIPKKDLNNLDRYIFIVND